MEAEGSGERVQYQLEHAQQGLSSAEKVAGTAASSTPPELPTSQDDDNLQVWPMPCKIHAGGRLLVGVLVSQRPHCSRVWWRSEMQQLLQNR